MLRAVLNPWDVAAHGSAGPRAVALLLTGQPDQAPTELAASGQDRRFADVVTGLVSGDGESLADLRLIMDEGGDHSVAACVLLMASYRAEDRLEDALEVVDSLQKHGHDTTRGILGLHRSATLARIGRVQEAYELSKSLVEDADPSDLYGVMTEVAARNHVSIAFQVGEAVPWRRPERSGVLDSIEGTIASGLNVFARQSFDRATEQPGSHTFTWSAVDPVGSPLEIAYRQAEAVADISLSRDAARLVGRYAYMSTTDQDAVVHAVCHLRTAEDVDAIKRVAWRLWSGGPLGTLKRLAEQTVAAEWHPHDVRAHHVLLSQGASLLSQRQAGEALRLLRSRLTGVAHRPRAADGDPDGALHALARLLPFVSPKDGSSTATWLLGEIQAADPRDALVLQAVPRVVDAIDWDRVAQATVDRWLAYSDKYLGEPVDHTFVARAAVVGMARAGILQAQKLVDEEFDRAPNLASAAMLLGTRSKLSDGALQRVLTVTLAEMGRVLERAHRGEYSIGGYDVGAMVADIALRGAPSAWPDLAAFITDPAVAAEHKEGAVGRLLQAQHEIPLHISERLAASVEGLTGPELPLLSDPRAMDVLRVRLAVAVGGFTTVDLLSVMLDIAHGSLSQRVAAAHLLPAAAPTIGEDVAVVIALELARDADAAVAGAACRSLTEIAPRAGTHLIVSAAKTLAGVVAGPGALGPLEAIRGLTLGASAAPQLIQAMARSLEKVAREHPDGWVRRAARAALIQSG